MASTNTLSKHSLSGVDITLADLLSLRYVARQLKIKHAPRVSTKLIGETHSTFKGRGLEFDEVRIYQPGDDIRTMDWRVTAKTGIAHTKLYHEERERPVFIVTDFSQSMLFGTRVAYKAVKAAELAALIAWTSILSHDRVGGIVFSDERIVELPPRGRKHGVLRFLRTLVDIYNKESKTLDKYSLPLSLKRLSHLSRPGSLIFIISDFYQHDASLERSLAQLRKHNEVFALQITDPLELEPPTANRYAISDGNKLGELDTRDKHFRDSYQQYFSEKHEKITKFLQQQNIPLWKFVTNEDMLTKLNLYLRKF